MATESQSWLASLIALRHRLFASLDSAEECGDGAMISKVAGQRFSRNTSSISGWWHLSRRASEQSAPDKKDVMIYRKRRPHLTLAALALQQLGAVWRRQLVSQTPS